MKTIRELLQEIMSGEIQVADVTETKTDAGDIIVVHLESMTHPGVLGFTVELPEEVRDQYSLGSSVIAPPEFLTCSLEDVNDFVATQVEKNGSSKVLIDGAYWLVQ